MSDLPDLARRAREQLDAARRAADDIQQAVDRERADLLARLDQLVRERDAARYRLDSPELEAFLKEPYVVIPIGRNEWRVACPRFISFYIGYLEQSTPSYNIFRVNRYAKWLNEIPAELERLFHLEEPMRATVHDGVLEVATAADQDKAWEKYKAHLTRRDGATRLKVKAGSEYDLLAQMVEDGILPFVPKPVQREHLLAQPAHGREPLKLRDYQRAALDEFLRKGAIGIFWMTGAGKTYPPLEAMARLNGEHLVVVPSAMAQQQWQERVNKHLSWEAARRVQIVTYQAWDKVRRRMEERGFRGWRLAVFDECHHLPANVFSRFASVPCDYRIGLSATPHREDGRENLIFALTGFPVGLDWQHLIELGVVFPPDVTLHITKSWTGKQRALDDLLAEKKRTVVFCDSLELGETISKLTGLPFVHGGTRDKLGEARRHHQVILSRVGDEAISLPDLEMVVELDFLGRSRRQEGQRMGRLFHATDKGEHHVLMTQEEAHKFEDRLNAIREKGFRIRVRRRDE